MIDIEKYSWGPTTDEIKFELIDEIIHDNMYNHLYDINEGDIVVDIGSSTGIFTFSILNKKPKHVFCLEPSRGEFPHLVKNTIGYPVTAINKAIGNGDGFTTDGSVVFFNNSDMFETIKFSTFINLYAIDHINFLKTDCEGGEYNIFTDENIDFLKEKVDYIVGEWHLGSDIEKFLFRKFRDNYLIQFKEFSVFSCDGVDIKWDLWNEHFIDYYRQVIIHISNK